MLHVFKHSLLKCRLNSENLAAKLEQALADLNIPEPAHVSLTDETSETKPLTGGDEESVVAFKRPALTSHVMRQV